MISKSFQNTSVNLRLWALCNQKDKYQALLEGEKPSGGVFQLTGVAQARCLSANTTLEVAKKLQPDTCVSEVRETAKKEAPLFWKMASVLESLLP